MKKIYFSCLLAALVCLAACTDEPDVAKNEEQSPVAVNPHRISQAQALQSLARVLEEIDTPATRGSSKTRTVQNIESVTRADLFGTTTRTGESPRDTLVYLVDLGEGNGSAVLGADDRLEPVIAVYDTKKITVEDLVPNEPARTLTLDDLYCPEDDDYYLGISTPPDPEESFQMDNILLFEYIGAVEIIDNGGNVHTKETGWFCTEFIPPMLTTLWHQSSPFSDRTPGNYPAGCVAIAVAQIMAYNEFPKNYCDWELAKQYDPYAANNRDDVCLELAKLSENIGRGCHIKYNFFWSGESFATPAKAKRFLRDIGYTGTSRHVGYDDSLIKDKLRADCPVFIGALTPNSSGHSWVIDGMISEVNKVDVYCSNNYLRTEYKKRLLLHCNWGWRGSSDGYFVSNAFNATKGPVPILDIYSETRGETDNNYTWWFRIVTYNKPK